MPDLAPLRGSARVIRIHGHRGARGIWPENTLSGFALAFEMGLQVVELDVLVSRDGQAVVTHNPALKAACTREHGAFLPADGPLVASLTMAEVQRFDIGALQPHSDYAARYPDQAVVQGLRVPTLAEVADLLRQHRYVDRWLNIEIKSDPGHPEATPPLADLVAATLAAIKGLEARVILQSFDWRVLHVCAQQAPEIPRSYLSYAPKPDAPMAANIYPGSPWMAGASGGSLPQTVARDGGRLWCPYHEDLTAEAIAEARALGLIVNVWTVNSPDEIDRMIALGVDGIITDYPGRVQQRLLAQGMHWWPDRTG